MPFSLNLQLQQRLEIRLTLELRQQLVMAQQLLPELDSFAIKDKNAYYELLVLKNYLALLEKDKFKSVDDFIDFLDKKAKGELCVFEMGKPHQKKEKNKGEMNIPQLAKVLKIILNWWGGNLELVKQVISLNIILAGANECPSEHWTKIIDGLGDLICGKDEITHSVKVSFFSNLWNFLVGANKISDLEIVSRIELVEQLLEKFADLEKLSEMIKYLEIETRNTPSSTECLRNDLFECLEGDVSFEAFSFAVKAIVGSKRYQSNFLSIPIINSVKEIIGKKSVLDKINKLKNLPILMAIPLVANRRIKTDDLFLFLDKLDQLADNADFQKSKDEKRLMWRALNILHKTGTEEIKHFFGLVENYRQLIKCFQALEALNLRMYRLSTIDYPLEAKNVEQFMDICSGNIDGQLRSILNLSDADINQLKQDDIYKVIHRNGLLQICLTYAGLCREHDYQRGVEIVAEILRNASRKSFLDWRYNHEKSLSQLDFLEDDSAWRKKYSKRVVLGLTSGIKQSLGAIRNLASLLAEQWEIITGYSADSNIDAKFHDAEELLRSADLSAEKRKELGLLIRALRLDYGCVKFIQELKRINENSYSLLLNRENEFKKLKIKLAPNEESLNLIEQIVEIITKDNFRNLNFITIEDADEPYTLLNIGHMPIQSCMRWYEWTSYNKCLLAYVVDANKKVLVATNDFGDIMVRCILRFLPYEFKVKDEQQILPLLLIERPYCKICSDEILAAMIKWAVEKAKKIAEENETPVMLGVKDEDMGRILKKSLDKLFKKATRFKAIKIKLPESYNDVEYSDSFGGEKQSGSEVSTELLTCIIK